MVHYIAISSYHHQALSWTKRGATIIIFGCAPPGKVFSPTHPNSSLLFLSDLHLLITSVAIAILMLTMGHNQAVSICPEDIFRKELTILGRFSAQLASSS